MLLGRQLNIKVLDLCNATCSFCGYNKDRLAARIRAGYIASKVNVDDLKEKLPAIRAKGITILHLTGGEPTLHPRFAELVRAAKDAGFQVRTGTNGSLIDEDLVLSMKDAGIDYLWYSLDTFPFENHLKHRGFSSLETKMFKGITLLHKHKINFFGQTVLSRILPFENGLPDIQGHLDYYRKEMGIKRFVFSYPMYRPDTSDMTHLATLGGSAVEFTKEELVKMFSLLLEIKKEKGESLIVNPNLSIRQQLLELKGEMDWAGCHAGRDIFFLGADQKTLRPCYHFSERIVDNLDGKPLKPDLGYMKCTDCRDQCFRDPSIAYAAISRPWNFMKQAIKNPPVLGMAAQDIMDLVANNGYRNI